MHGSSSWRGSSRQGCPRSSSRARWPTSVPRGPPSPSERRRCSRSRSRSRCSDEPVEAQLVVGAVAIVAGGTILVAEPDRPGPPAVVRDPLRARRGGAVRDPGQHRPLPACRTGAPRRSRRRRCSRACSSAIAAARGLPSRREVRSLAPAGLLFGFSYICLFEAYFHGRVSVVSPLIATESLWGVGLAALVIGRSEAVGWRVVCGGGRDRRRERPDRPRCGLARICYKEA